MSDGLSVLAPYPPAVALPPGYDRHSPSIEALRAALLSLVDDVDWAALDWAELIDALLTVGRADVPLSRLAEGHVDALRILGQAGVEPEPGALYGVWASRSQRTGVRARREASQLILDGTLRFASGAGLVDRALTPVWLSEEEHLLLDLGVSGLPVDDRHWVTSAMEVSRSHTVTLEAVSVPVESQVGRANFYLSRPAFFPGGVGVAACWAGGAARIADLTHARLRDPALPLLQRLGRLRVHLATAGGLVRTAAARLDSLLSGPTSDTGQDLEQLQALSTETRAGVAAAVHAVISEAQRIAGPAGLAYDQDLTRAIHDLHLYVLQQNSDADERFLGEVRR